MVLLVVVIGVIGSDIIEGGVVDETDARVGLGLVARRECWESWWRARNRRVRYVSGVRCWMRGRGFI